MKVIRNIKNVAISALLIGSALFFINESLAANTAKVNVETANLREKADSNSKILTLLPIDQKVEILGKEEDWYKVKVSGITGYLRQDIITLDGESTPKKEQEPKANETIAEVSASVNEQENKEQNENQVQKTEETNKMIVKENSKLKIIPAINATDVAEVKQNEEVEVKEKINGWVCVEKDLAKGWIREEKLSGVQKTAETPTENVEAPTEPTAAEPAKPAEPVAEVVQKTLYINSELVNMRKEASTTSEVVSRLAINTAVDVYGEQNGWYKVKVNGNFGYISVSLLSDKKQETSKSTTSRGTTVSRTSTKTNVAEQKTSNTNTTTTATESKTETTNVATTAAPSKIGATVVETAKNYIGSKYVYGGSSPSGFDCSGFTSYVYRQHGVTLNRTAAGQYSNGTAVSKANLQPGDLVMFGSSASAINHVGIYIGGGQIVHASTPKTGVRIDTINSRILQ